MLTDCGKTVDRTEYLTIDGYIVAKVLETKREVFNINMPRGGITDVDIKSIKIEESSIQSDDKYISVNALVVCGAVPIYVNPGTNKQLGIPLGMSVKDVEEAIKANPDAKAVLVNNPTYYGVCSDIKKIFLTVE